MTAIAFAVVRTAYRHEAIPRCFVGLRFRVVDVRSDGMDSLQVAVIGAHSVYYLLTGVWPLLHLRSFVAVTGPKTDWWLVRTVGALIAVVGLALGASLYDANPLRPTVVLLALGSAVALALVDVVYVARGTIARIYLLDAAAEALLIAGWIFLLLRM